MATDKTEPRMKLIVGVAALSVVTLVALRAFLVTYFSIENDAEAQAKVWSQTPDLLIHQREAEHQRMENGPVPVEQAMHLMSEGARPATIEPQPSVDYAPMQGWMQMPRPWTAPAIQPAPPAMPGAPVMQGGPSATGSSSAAAGAPAAIVPSSSLTHGAVPSQPMEGAPAAH